MRIRIHSLVLAAVSAGLMSCASHKKPDDSLNTQGQFERRLLKPNTTKTHPFEKQFNIASAGDRGAMKSWGKKGFHTNDVAGMKSFTGSKDYHTSEFSQAGKASKFGTQTTRYDSQTNRMGTKTFATKSSRYAGQTAHESTQAFSGANNTYKTGEFQPATKSLEDNKRIYMENGTSAPEKSANAYSEDDVRRMLRPITCAMVPAQFIPEDYFCEATKAAIFPDPSRPLEIDLGCGDGTFLLAMAKHHPERDFLGVERMPGRYDKVTRMIEASGLTNVRVLRLESSYTVGWLLPAQSVSRLHLLCPDPWPKAGHARRRLVRLEEFQRGLTRILEPGGEFLLKTDDAVYFEDAQEQFSALPEFTRAEWKMGDFFYAMTDFERHWLRLDRTINRARWIRAA